MPMRQLLMSCQPGSSQDLDLGGITPIIDLMASYELIDVRRRLTLLVAQGARLHLVLPAHCLYHTF